MTTSADIERIVRRVLKRMLDSDAHISSPTITNSTTLQLTGSPITLASLPDALEGISELLVSSRAIVTPAVRDRLRAAKVALNRTSSSTTKSPESSSSVGKVAEKSIVAMPPFIIAGTATYLNTLHKNLCPKQFKVLPRSKDDAIALREVATGIRESHRFGLLVVESAHSICWQAARDDRLRPAVLSQWNDLPDLLREVPTNILVLSSKHWNAVGAINIARRFQKGVVS